MVIQEEIVIPELSGQKPRRLFVYLPEEDFPEEEAVEEFDGQPEEESADERRYPVLYMFDGHNVFFDQTATYGKSWGMKDYLDKNRVPLIVVAAECNHEGNRRLEEYSPYLGKTAFAEIGTAQGRETMEWFVNTLKPTVDQFFPTLPDREHTMIAGSSMGGLMALYAGTVYHEVYGGAAALSPSIVVDYEALLSDVKNHPPGAGSRIYLSCGTKEGGDRKSHVDRLKELAGAAEAGGAVTKLEIIPEGTHSEAAWEKQIPSFLSFLMEDMETE